VWKFEANLLNSAESGAQRNISSLGLELEVCLMSSARSGPRMSTFVKQPLKLDSKAHLTSSSRGGAVLSTHVKLLNVSEFVVQLSNSARRGIPKVLEPNLPSQGLTRPGQSGLKKQLMELDYPVSWPLNGRLILQN
jgi:hypothetical protein